MNSRHTAFPVRIPYPDNRTVYRYIYTLIDHDNSMLRKRTQLGSVLDGWDLNPTVHLMTTFFLSRHISVAKSFVAAYGRLQTIFQFITQ